MHSLITLPAEFVYRILDQLSDFDLFCSMQNVCYRLNQILNTYHRYQTLTTLKLWNNSISKEGAQQMADALRVNMVCQINR
ncbi:unnamed protein product [Adineta ricciae]|uniref:F-box domain-containing protein n=1 Tax=Adineta ricciae TaxID=249248 RepID=A0A815S5S7_ADIRI|nr:unnamed protein product [Adineta ricciae]